MDPLFDRFGRLVAWLRGDNIFDPEMNWVAFRSSGNLFSRTSVAWLGPVDGDTIYDRKGRPVALTDGATPDRRDTPVPPPRPVSPLMPQRPLATKQHRRPTRPIPVNAPWSDLSWSQYVNQR